MNDQGDSYDQFGHLKKITLFLQLFVWARGTTTIAPRACVDIQLSNQASQVIRSDIVSSNSPATHVFYSVAKFTQRTLSYARISKWHDHHLAILSDIALAVLFNSTQNQASRVNVTGDQSSYSIVFKTPSKPHHTY